MNDSSGSGGFDFPTLTNVQSECIYYNNDEISSVMVTATETLGSGGIAYWIGYTNTLDTSITWEQLSRGDNELNGAIHTFSSTGKYIYWKARGGNDAILSKIKIKVLR